VIVAVDGLTPTDAIITSPEAVPAGREMVSVVLVVAADVAARNAGVESVADVADRNWALPAVEALALRNAGWAEAGALNAIPQSAQTNGISNRNARSWKECFTSVSRFIDKQAQR
jgi:hypothetical protein